MLRAIILPWRPITSVNNLPAQAGHSHCCNRTQGWNKQHLELVHLSSVNVATQIWKYFPQALYNHCIIELHPKIMSHKYLMVYGACLFVSTKSLECKRIIQKSFCYPQYENDSLLALMGITEPGPTEIF